MAFGGFQNKPLLLLSLAFVLGIVVGDRLDFTLDSLLKGALFFVLVLGLIRFFSGRFLFLDYCFGSVCLVVFFVFGITHIALRKVKNQSNHFSHIVSRSGKQQKHALQLKIKKIIKPTIYNYRYLVSVQMLDSHLVTGDLLLKISRVSGESKYKTGDIYACYTQVLPIPKSHYPDVFDYSEYLKRRYVLYQAQPKKHQLAFLAKGTVGFYDQIIHFRKYLEQKIDFYDFSKRNSALIKALLLGQRNDLDTDFTTAYKDAGVFHILALSGLHIGLFVYLLHFVLSFLNRFGALGKFIKVTAILLFLWFYAFMTGLSASVVRAVTMFSFYAIGMFFQSRGSSFDMLLISMGAALCVDPMLLFQLGFQLSYAAVFSILWIQPLFFQFFNSRFRLFYKLGEITSVSLAAQLGLFPLTMYYFHQFPLLFLVSNAVVLAILPLILVLGLVVLLLSAMDSLPKLLVSVYGEILDLLHAFVYQIAKQQTWVVKEIPYSMLLMGLSYLVIFFGVAYFKTKSKTRKVWFQIALLALILYLGIREFTATNQKEFLILHQNQETVLLGYFNKNLQIYSACPSDEVLHAHGVKNYRTLHALQNQEIKNLGNFYKYLGKKILIIDQGGIYELQTTVDFVLLSNSPKIHLEKMIQKLCPAQIIADGSNYKSAIDRWEKTCKQKQIRFHRTDRDGAFVLGRSLKYTQR